MKRTLLTLMTLFCLSFTATAQPPALLNYQGVLKDTAGKAVANGTYQLTFGLYTVATGGTALWTEVHPSVATSQGIFNVVLGGVTPFGLSFDQQYYLGITVGADPEMAPRNQLTSAPYAMNTTYSTFTPQFLTVDTQSVPSIFTKAQSGNANYFMDISTSVKCNVIVMAQSKTIPVGGWVSAVLYKDGSQISKQYQSLSHGSNEAVLFNMHTFTLDPSDGTIQFYIHDLSGSGDNGLILENRYTVYAVPIE